MEKEYKPDLSKFFNDPEFHYVIEMLSKNTISLRDIATIDLGQSAETIKAQVAGRQETLKVIDNFIHEVGQYKQINNKTPTSFA